MYSRLDGCKLFQLHWRPGADWRGEKKSRGKIITGIQILFAWSGRLNKRKLHFRNKLAINFWK